MLAVIAAPELMAQAATDIATIGSNLSAAHMTAAAQTHLTARAGAYARTEAADAAALSQPLATTANAIGSALDTVWVPLANSVSAAICAAAVILFNVAFCEGLFLIFLVYTPLAIMQQLIKALFGIDVGLVPIYPLS
jgi:ABC-type transporter Mla subunit MlaD